MTSLFAVARDDLRRTHWIESASEPLAEGAVRVHIESFALTSNNITYAAFGEAMHYWEFFPTGEAATGCVPGARRRLYGARESSGKGANERGRRGDALYRLGLKRSDSKREESKPENLRVSLER